MEEINDGVEALVRKPHARFRCLIRLKLGMLASHGTRIVNMACDFLALDSTQS